jgi:4-amino-4-deoxy-L-arabinose transferase-like glycosyltransferase
LAGFTIMSFERQFRWGVPVGILVTTAAAIGVLDFLGSFDDPEERVARRVTLSELRRPLAAVLVALTSTLLSLEFAVHGWLPAVGAAVAVTGSFMALVVSVFRLGVAFGPWAVDETGETRPLVERHGFWVVTVGTLLYLPMAGNYSLSDPWETHYGEVAREMLARNDWISTWWAQEGWFLSKPVLDFWMQALAMALFGVDYRAGMMLGGAETGHTPRPEWALRMPVFILTILALYVLYKAVAKVFGRRAGMLGALVLATSPYWFFLAHQTTTDMPLVASLSVSMGLLIIGIHTDPSTVARAYEISAFKRKYRLTAYHLVFGIILLSVLPQILYLLSRNAELQWLPRTPGFRWRLDEFWSGSKGNCGLPGNEPCRRQSPFNADFQPALQGAMWSAVLGFVLYLNWGERRLQRLYFLAAWFFAAVATLGKGPAGFGLPVLVTFAYVAATRNWQKLTSLEILGGLLIVLVVSVPWYVAMYVRHGPFFTDQLIFQHMYKRALTHIHDTNEGDDVSFRYYVWQLGYGLFPWTGLVPAGLLYWLRRRDDADRGQGDVSVFLAMWFVFAFALFTAMPTKFHHYVFPAVPPAAMLTGIFLDRLMGAKCLASGSARRLLAYFACLGCASLSLLIGISRLFPGSIGGDLPERASDVRPASPVVAAAWISFGFALAIAAAFKLRVKEEPPDPTGEPARQHEDAMLGGVAIASAVVVGLVGRDLTVGPPASDVVGQARLLDLFTYSYHRLWPDTLDWSGFLAAVAIWAAALSLGFIVVSLRRHIAVMLVATALAWALWGLDVYWVRAAPHWGQREVLEAYFKLRGGADAPLVAYQMNWKGENFYSGNHLAIFVSTGAPFTRWIGAERERGVRTFWFLSEHARTNGLRSEIGSPKIFEVVTTRRLNNKFCLVKAVFDS